MYIYIHINPQSAIYDRSSTPPLTARRPVLDTDGVMQAITMPANMAAALYQQWNGAEAAAAAVNNAAAVVGTEHVAAIMGMASELAACGIEPDALAECVAAAISKYCTYCGMTGHEIDSCAMCPTAPEPAEALMRRFKPARRAEIITARSTGKLQTDGGSGAEYAGRNQVQVAAIIKANAVCRGKCS